MQIKVLKSKIHGATVTEANLNYKGSFTIPVDVARQVELLENEEIYVWNLTNGNRISTYAIFDEQENYYAANGAAAHLFNKGDQVIITSFGMLDTKDHPNHKPLIYVDPNFDLQN